jgi:lycopene cyclase domain-containing protein
MTAYGWFLLIAAAGPLIVWARPQWRHHAPIARGIIFVWMFVSVPWLLLDAGQHEAHFWQYSPSFVSSLHVLNLPLEEGLFFFVIPLACLIFWSLIVRHRSLPLLIWLGKATIALLVLLGCGMAVFYHGAIPVRSMIDLLLVVIVGVSMWGVTRSQHHTEAILSWTGVVMGLFLLGNLYLTALPIVIYNDALMVPWRFGTIPLSDMHYNFAFLWMTLVVYLLATRPRAGSMPQNQNR